LPWDTSVDFAYIIYIDIDSNFTSPVSFICTTNTYTPALGLMDEMDYYWKVKTADEYGHFIWSNYTEHFSTDFDCSDADEDGLCSTADNCPDEYNPFQEDNDGDGIGDVCDNCPDDHNPSQADGDSDGYADACDNCPGDYNPDQIDSDGDGIGDECEVPGDVTIRLNGGADVAYIGETNAIEIWITNEQPLMSMSMGFEYTIERDYIFDTTYGNYPPFNEEGDAIGTFDIIKQVLSEIDNDGIDSTFITGLTFGSVRLQNLSDIFV